MSRSEVITLAIFSQWYLFRNQRDFYRQNGKMLQVAFPSLPSRPQFNRLMRAQHDAIVAFCLHLVNCYDARNTLYEVLDTTGVPIRNVKHRGNEWLDGEANIGNGTGKKIVDRSSE